MKDASEVLVKILECFNRSFTAGSGVSITKSSGSKGAGYCRSDVCIAHNLFGRDIRQKCTVTNVVLHRNTQSRQLFTMAYMRPLSEQRRQVHLHIFCFCF